LRVGYDEVSKNNPFIAWAEMEEGEISFREAKRIVAFIDSACAE